MDNKRVGTGRIIIITATAVALLAVAVLLLYPVLFGAQSPGWHGDAVNRYYIPGFFAGRATGLTRVDGAGFFFNDDGVMLHGWHDAEGYLRWFDSDSGEMVTGDVVIENENWHFDEEGRLLVGVVALDGTVKLYNDRGYPVNDSMCAVAGKLYCSDKDGVPVKGLLETDDGTYFFGDDYAAVSGWAEVNGSRLYFDTDYRLMTGWAEENDGMRYLFDNGTYAEGMVELFDALYYFGDDGCRVYGWQTIDGKAYHFDENGKAAIGWTVIDGVTYHFDDNGVRAAGMTIIDSEVYLFEADGTFRTGMTEYPGGMKYHDDHGYPVTGFYEVNGSEYYFGEDGYMVVGWVYTGGLCYFMDFTTGARVHGWTTVDGVKFYFLQSGEMATGWQSIGSKKYFFDINGIPLTGEQKINGVFYNLQSDGSLLNGWVESGSSVYYYSSRGYRVTGYQSISGKLYYFNTNGTMLKSSTVDIYTVNESGVCTKIPATAENINDYLDYILKYNGNSLIQIFEYVRSNLVYKKATPKADYEEMLIYALNYRKGVCYHYATLTHYLLSRAGYECKIIYGDGLYSAPEHYWNLVKVDGQWYHYDTLQNQYLKTDAYMIEEGYNWDFGNWPATP